MFTDPVTLIDQTLGYLNAVSELMKEEFDPRIHTELDQNGIICRSAYMRIHELIPKLQAARATQIPAGNSTARPICIGCE